jgi:circadian clock protein KaiC
VIEKFSTGIEGLDQLTAGGLLRGSAYIVQGTPGAGKTILANQLCYSHVRSGGRALYMTLLAESSARMLNYVRQMAFFEEDAVPQALQYVSAYGVLEREGLPGLLKLVQHEIKRHGATVMVLDGTFVAQSTASEQEFRAFIHALQGVAGICNSVLVMLTHQDRDSSSPEHTMVDGWIEMSDEMKGARSFRTIQIKKHRGAAMLPGKHAFRITERGISVFPRMESLLGPAAATEATTTRVCSGVPGLDELIDGGISTASATLLVGPTGAGKTITGLHFLAQATVEQPALMLGFFESAARIRAKARNIGIDLDALIESGALELRWLPPSENIVDEVTQELLRGVENGGVKRVLLDGLVPLRDNLAHPDRLPYLINALTLRLHALGATVLYTSEIRELSIGHTAMPSDELSAMVDNVVMLNLARHQDALHRYLTIIKTRDSDFDPRLHEFHITDRGIVFGPDPRVLAPGLAG